MSSNTHPPPLWGTLPWRVVKVKCKWPSHNSPVCSALCSLYSPVLLCGCSLCCCLSHVSPFPTAIQYIYSTSFSQYFPIFCAFSREEDWARRIFDNEKKRGIILRKGDEVVKDWSGRNAEKIQCLYSTWNTDSVIKSGEIVAMFMKGTRNYWSKKSREVDYLKELSVKVRVLWKSVFEKQYVKYLADSAGRRYSHITGP